MKNEYRMARITGLILEEQTELSLDEVCRACAAPADNIVEMVNEGLLFPVENAFEDSPDHWHFTGAHLSRARVALRLQKDLGVNLAGAALALDLLEELHTLRARLQRLETARD